MRVITVEQHNPNDSEEDEYTLSVQFMSGDFYRLLDRYEESLNRSRLGVEFKHPFEFGDPRSELDLVVWLAEEIRRKLAL